MKLKYILFCTIIALLAACDSDEEAPYSLFDTERSSYYAGDEIQFNNKSAGKNLEYLWDFGDGQTSVEANPINIYKEAGSYTVKLTVTSAGQSAVHKRILGIDQPAERIGEIGLNWISAKTFGYIKATSPAVDHNGDVVIASDDHILRKFAKTDGSQMWEFDLRNTIDGTNTKGGTYVVPSIDKDGTIYMGTGDTSGSLGRFYAINSDGSKKWMVPYGEGGFWASSGNPTPRLNHLNAAIGDNSIYIGNGGTTGSVLAIDKQTGLRKAYVANESNGGPGGGVTTGVLLDNKNNVFWFGGIYGLFRASATKMETDARVNWDWRFYTYAAEENVNSAMAIGSDGTIYGLANYKTEGKSIFAIDGDATDAWPKAKWYCSVEPNAGKIDQGGVAIGPGDVIYAGLKRAVGTDGGGIIAITSSGTVKWRFNIFDEVSGTPAVDKAGNVHFATEAGRYYIVSSDGQTVILSIDLAELIIRNNPKLGANWAIGQAKCWNSPAIDADGTIYIGVTNMNKNLQESVLLSLKHKDVTGPANSAWPMRGQNAQRTNRQPN